MYHKVMSRTVVLLLIFILVAPAGQMMDFSWIGSARADPPIGFNMSQRKALLSSYPSDEPILIWDNDGNDAPDGSNGTEYFINRSLDALGYANVILTAQGEDLANYDLSNYTVVFALFGMAAGTGNLTPGQETQLTNFLDAGGRLYVEGGDIGFNGADGAGSGEFSNLWPYLKANYISNGGSYGNLNGTGSYLTKGMNFDYTGDNSSMDVIAPSTGGFGMFNNTTNTLAVGHNGTYRTVLFSFQFGGLKNSNTSTRDELMKRMMHFFSYIKVVDIAILGENIHTPMSFEGDTDDGWTHAGAQDNWQRGKPTSGPNAAHTGDNVWATNLAGNYPNLATCYLYLPDVMLGGKSNITFWHWYSTQRGDRGNVEVYNDAFNRWDIIARYDGQSNGWREVSLSLSGYTGAVSIRFAFSSDNQLNAPGWYLDDFLVWTDNVSMPLSNFGLYKRGEEYIVGNEIEIEPVVTVRNNGNTFASFDLLGRVYYRSNNTEVYNHTILVNLSAGAMKDVVFPTPWNTSGIPDVQFDMEFLSLAPEENGTGGDNMISFGVYVGNYTDLYAEGIGINSDEPILPGTNINPTGNFINLGNVNLSNFTATLKITNALSQVVYWENVSGQSLNLPFGNNTTVVFPQWIVPVGDGDYLFNMTHNLTDNNNTNNVRTRSVRAEEYYDISVDSFDFNVTQPLNSSDIVTLMVKITNWGNMNATNFPLRCVVQNRTGAEFFNQTNNSVTVNLPMSNTSTIKFNNMNLPSEEGNITVIIDVLWGNDENASNSNLTGEASIDDHHDIGLVSPDSVTMEGDLWYDHYKRGSHQSSVNVTNYGNVNQTSVVDFKYGIELNPLYLFEDDVESPKSWYNFDLGGAPAEFHIVEPNSPHSDFHSPAHSWWFGDEGTGNYGNNLVNVLVARIDLRNESMAWLNFWQKYSFAVNDWSCVVYNTDSVDNPQNPFAQYIIYDGVQFTGNSGGWVNTMYDISSLCGQEILIGFAGVTDAAGVSSGLYVDDVYLSIPNYTVIETHRVTGQELAPGDSEILTDNYNFAENATYYLVPETALEGDENSGNNPGLLRVQVKDFPDLAPVDIGLTNARPTYFLDDFENDGGGLVPTGANSFTRGAPAVPGGPVLEDPNTKCWAVDLDSEYGNDMDIFLTGRLDIKNYTGAMLSFDQWYDIEEHNDGLWVEIKNASDGNFRNVTPLGGYPKTIPGKAAWPNGAARFPCFNDHSGGGDESIWETVLFNISEYAGNVVYVRFRFMSDNAIIRPGWFMDNLTVYDPIIEARYRLNRNVNSIIDFDLSNLGNIPSVGGTAQLTIKGITDDTYSYTDSLSLSNVAAGASGTKSFSTPWTSPNVEGLYLATISLDSPDDFMPTNSNMSIIIEVQDSHNIMAWGITDPLPYLAYPIGDTISLSGLVRNVGTHDEIGITVNATITDVENESWEAVKFTTTIDLKLKENHLVEFTWTIPPRLGAQYRLTYEVGHAIDGNSTDNTFSVDFFALPENMNSAAFGFVFDNSSDSPYYGESLDNVTVQLKVKGSFNAIATEKTDENGYFSMDLSAFTRGLDYTLQFVQDWYLYGKYDFYMRSDMVYKCNIGMLMDNLNPRAALSLPMEEPYYVLAGDEVSFNFADTSDGDTPAQMLTYRLESDIGGLMYEGSNVSFISILEPGTHILTLTVMDEMGGEDNTSIEVISYASSWNTLTSDDGSLTVELLSAGPGTLEINDGTTIEIPDELLDIGHGYNFKTEGVIFVLEARIALDYNESDLHHNAREEDLRFYKYDHEYPGTSWELVIPFITDLENDTLSITLTGKNRSWDIDLIPLAVTDVTSPHVIKTVPAEGATGVSVFSDINITFSENILLSQFKKEGVTVEEGKNALDFDMEYNDTTFTLRIIPRQDKLSAVTDYRITITGVYDLVYNAMDDFTFSFRTGEWEKTQELVSGFVRDLEYKAIPGAKIIVEGVVLGTSDENGFYSIYLGEGIHTITVNKTGFLDSSEKIEMKMGIPVTRTFFMKNYVFLDIVLITGHIIDDSTNPMEDVIIKLDGKVRGYTDMMGNFRIEILRGIYDLTASRDGHAPYQKEINLINGSIDLNITLRKMDFAIVTGNVKDRSGRGIEGVKVEFTKQGKVVEETTTDADGNYYMELPAGSYIIRFNKKGYKGDTSDSLRVEEGEEKVMSDLILQEEEKTVSQSAASTYWPWLVLFAVIGVVVILIFLVIKRPAGKQDGDEFEEAVKTADTEEGEAPGPEVVSVDIDQGVPPGPSGPPGPPGAEGGISTAPVGETGDAVALPQMEERSALADGTTEMLALPAGPEEPVTEEEVEGAEMAAEEPGTGKEVEGAETDVEPGTAEPGVGTDMEEGIVDTGEPEAAVQEPGPMEEAGEPSETAIAEETDQEAVAEQPVTPAVIPEAEPVQPTITGPVPAAVSTPETPVSAVVGKPKRKVVRRKVVKRPVSK